MNIIEMGNYTQQLNLMISGGEKLDLMVTLPGDLPTSIPCLLQNQNQLTGSYRVSFLPEYAPELLETVPRELVGREQLLMENLPVTLW